MKALAPTLLVIEAMLLRELWNDAFYLTREACGRADPRSIARTVLKNDSFRILLLQRLRTAARRKKLPLLGHILRMAQTSVYGIEIGAHVELGYGVYFVHPVGVVIGGDARIGARTRFLGSNTVGTCKENGYPVVGERVVVGAGARVLGPIEVGDHAVVGANAVVLRDVPARTTVAGVPARPVRVSPALVALGTES